MGPAACLVVRSSLLLSVVAVSLLSGVAPERAVLAGGIENNGTYARRSGDGGSVTVPVGYNPQRARYLRFSGRGFQLAVFSPSFSQGEAGYVELSSTGNAAVVPIACHVLGRSVSLHRRRFGHAGLFGIGVADKPGQGKIRLVVRVGGETIKRTFTFQVHTTNWRTFESSMDLGRYSRSGFLKKRPDLRAFIQANRIKKNAAFSRRTGLKLDGRFVHPRDRHFVTSPFRARRVSRRYTLRGSRVVEHKPGVSVHSGTDLKGKSGEPIFALASGRVVIAEKMYYEGNFTVIDHGHGIFTTYMHQSRLNVKEGQIVEGGQLIGLVGATGMVTGPHLHISLYIRNLQLDALSLLVLPVRS